MMTFSINQVRSEKALLEKQEQLLKLREEQLVQVDKRCDNIFSTQPQSYLLPRNINVKSDSAKRQ